MLLAAEHFNPLFPYGKRPLAPYGLVLRIDFNPLFPYGKRLTSEYFFRSPSPFQSTLPIREETRRRATTWPSAEISIHSSHTGRDLPMVRCWIPWRISIHSSHTGRDLFFKAVRVKKLISIHSSHTGRDFALQRFAQLLHDFNPLFPYGKRPNVIAAVAKHFHFNPLFPYGKRLCVPGTTALLMGFQSTLPIREETSRPEIPSGWADFNPLFPYGKRRRANRVR